MQQRLTWQPQILDLRRAPDRHAFEALKPQGKLWSIHDTIEEQIEDLVRTRNPQWIKRPVDAAQVKAEMAALLNGIPLDEYGRWVYYPWSGEMVHLLPPAQFRELRLNRNQNKITHAEQEQLDQITIGIAGLSVGNAVAMALAIEGIGGHLKLADFDRLDLSNMNRIRAKVSDIALPKTMLCARQIFEMNPYAQVELFANGLKAENLEAFFGGDPALDIVIDECDDIRIKFLLREAARARGIPVLMETSDRGMLDVERFDREPQRPLFHGLLGDTTAADVPANLTNEEKVPFVAPIIGVDALSARCGASMIEIGETITTWPQLGSEVLLGGATVSAAVRALVLNGELASGRRYIDLADLIHKQACPAQPQTSSSPPVEEMPTRSNAQPQQVSELMHFLVAQAILAPSGGNSQPWRFYTDNQTLWVVHDRVRSRNLLDPDHRGAYVALGAAIENIRIAAAQRGYATQISYFPTGEPPPMNEAENDAENDAAARDEIVAALQFEIDGTMRQTALAAQWPHLQQRMTDRKSYGRTPLQSAQRDALLVAAERHGCDLTLLETERELVEIGAIVGEGDRLRFLCAETHRELMAEMRWTAEEAQTTGDGVDIATLELTVTEATGIQLLRRPEIAHLLRSQHGGSSLKELSEKAIKRSSAVGLIRITGSRPHELMQGGQAIEALWIVATQLGITWHPMTSLLYMFHRQFTPEFTLQEAAILRQLQARFDRLFPVYAGDTALLLFRLSQGQSDGLRSLRRPIDQVLTFGTPPYDKNRKGNR
ncbi:MAG: Rv1355c family protein [Caldilineaceae bacterium]